MKALSFIIMALVLMQVTLASQEIELSNEVVNTQDCYDFPYFYLETATSDIILTDNNIYGKSCVRLRSKTNGDPIYFDHTIILDGWGELTFYCNESQVIRKKTDLGDEKPAFKVSAAWTVQDCKIRFRETGYELYENAQLSRSHAGSNKFGVIAYDNSRVFGGNFTRNDIGVVLHQNSKADNVRSEENQVGFLMFDNSETYGTRAGFNRFTLTPPEGASDSGVGYLMNDNSKTIAGWTNSNNVGYKLYGNSFVYQSRSEADYTGIVLEEFSTCRNCRSSLNSKQGIIGNGDSIVSDSLSEYTCLGTQYCYGIELNGNSQGINVESRNNERGIKVTPNALLKNSRACENSLLDLYYRGTLEGTVLADSYDGGETSANLFDCSWTDSRRSNKFQMHDVAGDTR